MFADDDPRGDGELAKIKTIEDGAHQPDAVVEKEKIASTPPQ